MTSIASALMGALTCAAQPGGAGQSGGALGEVTGEGEFLAALVATLTTKADHDENAGAAALDLDVAGDESPTPDEGVVVDTPTAQVEQVPAPVVAAPTAPAPTVAFSQTSTPVTAPAVPLDRASASGPVVVQTPPATPTVALTDGEGVEGVEGDHEAPAPGGTPRPVETAPTHGASTTTPTASPTPPADSDEGAVRTLPAPAEQTRPAAPAPTQTPPTTPVSSPVAQQPGPTAPIAATPPPAPATAAPLPSPPPMGAQLSGPLMSLRNAGEGTHVMTVRVNPEAFGPVRVVAHISAEAMRIELVGGTEQAREALRAALPDLRRDLAGAGLQADLDLSSSAGEHADQDTPRTPTSAHPTLHSTPHGDQGATAVPTPQQLVSTHVGALDVTV